MPDPNAFTRTRQEPGLLERYTVSDSGTTVYPTNVEGLAPFYLGRCSGVGEAPHFLKDCQIPVLGVGQAEGSMPDAARLGRPWNAVNFTLQDEKGSLSNSAHVESAMNLPAS
jgi:hypothetical protein